MNTLSKRLNPFIFPPETNVRFILFVVAALLISTHIGVSFTSLSFPLEGSAVIGTQESSRQLGAQVGESLRFISLQVGIAALMIFLAAIIFFLHPNYIRRKKHLAPLPPGKDPVLENEVQRLTQLAGVTPSPTVETVKGSRSINAQAFGFRRHYSLRLDGGLRLLLRKSPATFQALVLHELGHIVNGDVTRAYFSLALWLVVLLMAGGSLLLISVTSASYDLNDVALWLQIGFMVAIITVIWAGLLRVREFYADWQAATMGAGQALATLIKQMTPTVRQKFWTKPWRFHPSSQERLAVLTQPDRLFRVALEMPFLVGILLAFVLTGAPLILLQIATGVGSGVTLVQTALMSLTGNLQGFPALVVILVGGLIIVGSVLVVLFVCGFLVAGTLGLQVQREAVAEISLGRRLGIAGFLRLGLLASLVALGIELGSLITPIPLFSPLGAYWGGAATNPLLLLPWVVLWLLVVTGLFWLGFLFVHMFGARLLGSHVGASPPRWKYRLLTAIFSGWLGVAYLPLLSGRLAIVYAQSLGTDEMMLLITITLVGLISTLFLYAAMFALTWVLGQIIRPSRCPGCNKSVHFKTAVAERCEHCGEHLASWLLV